MKTPKTLELQKKVQQLHEEGNSYGKIAKMLGITSSYAHMLGRPDLYGTEHKKALNKSYKAKKKDDILKYGKQWREKNPDYMKNWYQAHKDKYVKGEYIKDK